MSDILSKEEKLKILKSIETDEEFRYSLLGALGFTEILKRLDVFEKNQEMILSEIRKLWEEVKELKESQNKLWEEVKELKESQNKLWEEVKELKESQNKLWEEVKELKATQNEILKEIAKLWQAVGDLRKDVNELKETTKNMQRTLERLTLSVEDEGREVIEYRLEKELGEKINLDRIFFDNEEIDIYGASNELFVIGEATVRLGIGLIEELERKIEKIKEKRQDLIRKKMIKLIYVDIATPDSIELAKKNGVWILTVKGDITPRIIHEINL
ncbi:MAG: hypothetical protein RXQ71_00390 [Caldisphaera sp.]